MGPSEIGVPFSLSPAATGGAAPFAWSLARGVLPAGLSLNAGTGAITGAPTAAGSFPLTLAVSDTTGSSATAEVTLTVAPRLAIATTRLKPAVAGHSYSGKLASAGGVGPATWATKGLPKGLRLNAKTGGLSGTPRTRGVYRVTVTATDALGARATRTLVLRVAG